MKRQTTEQTNVALKAIDEFLYAPSKPVYHYGETIQAARAQPHPTKRGEYIAEMYPAKVIGFSNYAASRRDWGWRGDVLVEFADGHKTWNPLL